MKEIRVLRNKAQALVWALIREGHEAIWKHGAATNLNCGCSDPDCCSQHPLSQEHLATVITDVSGNKAHKIWLKAGLVDDKF